MMRLVFCNHVTKEKAVFQFLFRPEKFKSHDAMALEL